MTDVVDNATRPKASPMNTPLPPGDVPDPLRDPLLGKAQHMAVDEGADSRRPGAKRVNDQGAPSPTRARGDPQGQQITLDAIRGLLQEQTRSLTDSHQQDLMDLKTATFKELGSIKKDVRKHGDYIDQLRENQEKLEERMKHLELRGPASLATTTSDVERPNLLILGGWPQDTQKETLLTELRDCLKQLGLEESFEDVFCTGPRRGFAMAFVTMQASESGSQIKRRMITIAQQIQRAALCAPSMETNRILKATLGKSKYERLISNHTGKTKRLILTISPNSQAFVETEYSAGNVWFHSKLVASATRMRPHVNCTPGKPERSWLDIPMLATMLKITEGEIAQQWSYPDNNLHCWPQKASGSQDDAKRHPRTLMPDLQPYTKIPLACWNIGGTSPSDAVQSTRRAMETKPQILSIQEMPRREVGWHTEVIEDLTVVQYRHDDRQWRGNAIAYGSDFQVLRRRGCRFGMWLRLRHLPSSSEIWIGSLRLSTGVTSDVTADELQEVCKILPATLLPVILMGDFNTKLKWTDALDTQGDLLPTEARSEYVLSELGSCGLCMKAPIKLQWDVPTSRPRWTVTSRLGETTKGQLQARRGAQEEWRSERNERAASGHWQSFNALKPSSGHEWTVHYVEAAEARQPPRWNKDIDTGNHFTLEDLREAILRGRKNKAVGEDVVPYELIQSLCEDETTEWAFLEWMERLSLDTEWHLGLSWCRIDIQKAFDTLARDRTLRLLRDRLPPEMFLEYRCWERLFYEGTAVIKTPWGDAEIPQGRGIRQGSVESPFLFSIAIEMALYDALQNKDWPKVIPAAPDIPLAELLFMDDTLLWAANRDFLLTKYRILKEELAKWGLKVNPEKTSYYCSPHSTTPGPIILDGQTIASKKFYANKHIFLASSCKPCGMGTLWMLVMTIQWWIWGVILQPTQGKQLLQEDEQPKPTRNYDTMHYEHYEHDETHDIEKRLWKQSEEEDPDRRLVPSAHDTKRHEYYETHDTVMQLPGRHEDEELSLWQKGNEPKLSDLFWQCWEQGMQMNEAFAYAHHRLTAENAGRDRDRSLQTLRHLAEPLGGYRPQTTPMEASPLMRTVGAQIADVCNTVAGTSTWSRPDTNNSETDLTIAASPVEDRPGHSSNSDGNHTDNQPNVDTREAHYVIQDDQEDSSSSDMNQTDNQPNMDTENAQYMIQDDNEDQVSYVSMPKYHSRMPMATTIQQEERPGSDDTEEGDTVQLMDDGGWRPDKRKMSPTRLWRELPPSQKSESVRKLIPRQPPWKKQNNPPLADRERPHPPPPRSPPPGKRAPKPKARPGTCRDRPQRGTTDTPHETVDIVTDPEDEQEQVEVEMTEEDALAVWHSLFEMNQQEHINILDAPVLPTHIADNIVDTLVDRPQHEHDLLVDTLLLFQGRLQMDFARALRRARDLRARLGTAGSSNDKVDPYQEADETDDTAHMQTTIEKSVKQVATKEDLLLNKLHRAFMQLRTTTASSRALRMANLLADHDGPLMVDRALLESLLIAVNEETPPAAEGDHLLMEHQWVTIWWKRLKGEPEVTDDDVEEVLQNIEDKIADQETATREAEQAHHEAQEAQYYRHLEEAAESHQEQVKAAEAQALDDAVLQASMEFRQTRSRTRMCLGVCIEAGQKVRAWEWELDKGTEVQIHIKAEPRTFPGQWFKNNVPVHESEVPDILKEPASSTTTPRTPSMARRYYDITKPATRELFDRWQRREISPQQVVQVGGTGLLAYFHEQLTLMEQETMDAQMADIPDEVLQDLQGRDTLNLLHPADDHTEHEMDVVNGVEGPLVNPVACEPQSTVSDAVAGENNEVVSASPDAEGGTTPTQADVETNSAEHPDPYFNGRLWFEKYG
ncbi:unnamed protein product [Symbiodinium sp. CCMP2456]|nr:unnamed protein product [Symbiodinium sp. CCMP2456]